MHRAARRVLPLVAGLAALLALGLTLSLRRHTAAPAAEAAEPAPAELPKSPVNAAAAASSQAAPAPPAPVEPAPCPEDMVLVEGSYCERVEHDCVRWLDDPSLPFARCGEYAQPARCRGARRPLRFCIDRFEYAAESEALPAHHLNFVSASKACRARNKRLCLESEWTLACEGPEQAPYPYGWSREPKCNQDRSDLYEMKQGRQALRDLRRAASIDSECKSPFGVYDMVGNVDELVQKDRGAHYPYRNALKGGWWMAGRNRCRPATTAHDDHYKDMQTGTRCCADAAPGAPERAP